MHDGLERMYGEKQENVYYYITTLNENYHMPAMPEDLLDHGDSIIDVAEPF